MSLLKNEDLSTHLLLRSKEGLWTKMFRGINIKRGIQIGQNSYQEKTYNKKDNVCFEMMTCRWQIIED